MEYGDRTVFGEATNLDGIVYWRVRKAASAIGRDTLFRIPILILAVLVTNAGTSDYNALQLQFHRQMSHGLQALASYTWSHSIDTASAGSFGNGSNLVSELNSNVNRGPSDFDIRNAFSMALTYDVPVHGGNTLANAMLRGWSLENVVQARSAPPVDVYYGDFGDSRTDS